MRHVVNVVFKCLEFYLSKLPVFHLINFAPLDLWYWLAVCIAALLLELLGGNVANTVAVTGSWGPMLRGSLVMNLTLLIVS